MIILPCLSFVNLLKRCHIFCEVKKEKATRLSTAGRWLLSSFKKLFNRVAKILCFVVFLVKIGVEHLFFQTGFKQVLNRLQNRLQRNFVGVLPSACVQKVKRKFVVWSCLLFAFRKPNKRFLLFLSCFQIAFKKPNKRCSGLGKSAR